jgi:hypothetical protein
MADEPVTQVVSIAGLEERLANRRLFARLDALSLADLLQLYSQRTDRSVFRVTSGSESGFLFFEAGQIHSASFGGATGLDAIAWMLRLETGAFEAWDDQPWPSVGNVRLATSTALLRATRDPREADAQILDELEPVPLLAGQSIDPLPPPFTRAYAVAAAASQDARPSSLELRGADDQRSAKRVLPPARFVVRTVDSVSLELGGVEGHGRDPELAELAVIFYQHCRKLGDALGLPRLATARLIDDLWMFLLFHESNPRRISAVLGARRRDGAAVEDSSGAARAGWDPELPRSLADLSDRDGIIGGFIAGPAGELLSSRMPRRVHVDDVALAARLSTQLLSVSESAGFRASAGELRFAGRRIAIRRSRAGLVAVVAVSSVSVTWLRELTHELAHGHSDTKRATFAEGASGHEPASIIEPLERKR